MCGVMQCVASRLILHACMQFLHVERPVSVLVELLDPGLCVALHVMHDLVQLGEVPM